MSTYGRKQVKELVAKSPYEEVCRKSEFVHPHFVISRLDKTLAYSLLEKFVCRFISLTCSETSLANFASYALSCPNKEIVISFSTKRIPGYTEPLSYEDMKIFMQMDDESFVSATSSWDVGITHNSWDELQEIPETELSITFYK